MSESSIKISIKFSDIQSAKKVEKILDCGRKKINDSFNAGKELFLHEYLRQTEETMGVDFDSWWIVEVVKRTDNTLYLEMIGSPSGTREQDIITWLNLYRAIEIKGKMILDGGGDIDVVKFGDDEEIDY